MRAFAHRFCARGISERRNKLKNCHFIMAIFQLSFSEWIAYCKVLLPHCNAEQCTKQ